MYREGPVEGDGLPPSTFGSPMILVLMGLCMALALYEYWFRNLRYVKMGNRIPGPLSIPILGNTYLAIGKSPSEIMKIALSIYGNMSSDVVRIWLGQKLIVGVSLPDDIEIILGSNVHLEKSQEYDLFKPWLGEGLLISKGEKWRSHRKMIAPTFHSSILKSFMPVFNKNARNLLENFQQVAGKEFDVHDYMSATTVDTLLETAMGVEKTKEDNTGYEYAMAVMKMCNILHLRHYKAWLRPDFLFKFTDMFKEQTYLLNIIHSLTRQVISRKKANYLLRESKGEKSLYKEAVSTSQYSETNGGIKESSFNYVKDDLDELDDNDIGEKRRLAFLDYMIEASHTNGNTLTDEDIKEEVDTIMFEGHDTTAAASSFVLSLLGIHRHIQEKVFQELKEIFQDDLDRPITFKDTVQMKYLECVILETLRLYPPVPLIARKLNRDVELATGDKYVIPAGTTIIIGIFVTHRHPTYFPNPEVFDPDNFLPEKCQNRPYYAYIPFSAGPRSCVGRKYAMLKLKVLLASVLRKYRITSLKKENEFKLQADIILKREDGFTIKIENRIN